MDGERVRVASKGRMQGDLLGHHGHHQFRHNDSRRRQQTAALDLDNIDARLTGPGHAAAEERTSEKTGDDLCFWV